MTWAAILTALVTGCVSTATNEAALCEATAQARRAHASALVADGGDASVVTGQRLLAMIKAGCAE